MPQVYFLVSFSKGPPFRVNKERRVREKYTLHFSRTLLCSHGMVELWRRVLRNRLGASLVRHGPLTFAFTYSNPFFFSQIHIKVLSHSKKSDFAVKCVNESQGGHYVSRCMATQKQPIQIFFGSSISSQPHFYNNVQPPVSCFQIDAATDLYYTYSYFTIVVPRQYFYLLR